MSEKREKEMSSLKGNATNAQSGGGAKDKRIVELTNESKEKDVRIAKLQEELLSAQNAMVTLLSAKDRIEKKQLDIQHFVKELFTQISQQRTEKE